MKKLLGTALMAAALSMTATNAMAEEVRETRAVDAKVTRVKLGGVVDLTVRQGATPSLVIWGDKRGVETIRTSQSGDTLQIDSDTRTKIGWSNRKVNAELTVPNLAEFVTNGVGSTRITGFSGDAIRLALDGAGSVVLESNYRNVDARLGGVGSLTMDGLDAQRMDLQLRGAGSVTASGQAKVLNAKLGGVGSLKADKLRADVVDLDMSGIGSAGVYAKSTATVDVSGLGSASIYGNPATRKGNSSGMGKIHWK